MIISDWRVTGELGRGGMGVVYEVEHIAYRYRGAMKLAHGTSERQHVALQQEIATIAALEHDNVIPIFDQGEHEGQIWFVMERGERAVTEVADYSELRSAMVDLLSGLAAAHGAGILHLDVKPSNLLRCLGRVVLADFGLAIASGTTQRTTWGSLPYMAPERFNGQISYLSEATDLYSVGCIAFALAHRSLPFVVDNLEQARHAHCELDRPTLLPKFPVPAGFVRWIGWLMNRSPLHRPRSAAHALQALHRLGGEQSKGAPSVGGLPQANTTTATVEIDCAEPAPAPRPSPCAAQEAFLLGQMPTFSPADRPKFLGGGLMNLRNVPFVGREEELGHLWRRLQQVVEEERARGVGLVGPSGIGKTRLARSFLYRCGVMGCAVFDWSAAKDQWLLETLRCESEAELLPALTVRFGPNKAEHIFYSSPGDQRRRFLSVVCEARPAVVFLGDRKMPPWVKELKERVLFLTTVGPSGLALAPLKRAEFRQMFSRWVGLLPDVVSELSFRCQADVSAAIEMVRVNVSSGHLRRSPGGLVRHEQRPLISPQARGSGSFVASHQRVLAAIVALENDSELAWLARWTSAQRVEEGLKWLESEQCICIIGDSWTWIDAHRLRAFATCNEALIREVASELCEVSTDEEGAFVRGLMLMKARRFSEAAKWMGLGAFRLAARGGMAEANWRLFELEQELVCGDPSNPALAWCWYGQLAPGPTYFGSKWLFGRVNQIERGAAQYEQPQWQKVKERAVHTAVWMSTLQLEPALTAQWLGRRGDNTPVRTLDYMGWHYLNEGRFLAARRCFEELSEKCQRGSNFDATSQCNIYVAAAHLGQEDVREQLWAAGQRMLGRGIESARGDLYTHYSDCLRWNGALEEALDFAERAVCIAAGGEARSDPGFDIARVKALVLLNRLEEAYERWARIEPDLSGLGLVWRAYWSLQGEQIKVLSNKTSNTAGLRRIQEVIERSGFVHRDLPAMIEQAATTPKELRWAEQMRHRLSHRRLWLPS